MEKRENPWLSVALDDYENHMRREEVFQLQTLNAIMCERLQGGVYRSVMILGVAGGNGLEYVDPAAVGRVYGVDVNPRYLAACTERYPALKGVFVPVCADLTEGDVALPNCDLLTADLFVEYIGCARFIGIVKKVAPTLVSCVIQRDEDASYVSPSPYRRAFDCLDEIHRQIDGRGLIKDMRSAGYVLQSEREYEMPNGKKLIKTDFSLRREEDEQREEEVYRELRGV